MPLEIDPITIAPSSADQTEPRPPNRLVPAITGPAIANSARLNIVQRRFPMPSSALVSFDRLTTELWPVVRSETGLGRWNDEMTGAPSDRMTTGSRSGRAEPARGRRHARREREHEQQRRAQEQGDRGGGHARDARVDREGAAVAE